MTERLYRDIGEQIKADLAQQELAPGSKLPTERAYAERFGTSRTVVREAFIMLEIEGWIEVRQASGIYLRQRPGSPISPQRVPDEDIGPFELLQARQVLESSIAACAAQTVTKQDIQQMQEMLDLEDTMMASVEVSEDADRRFHLLIARSTQNSLLLEMCTQLWDRRDRSPMWQTLHKRIMDLSYRANWLEDHRAILNQLRKRDAQGARQAMWQHLENVKTTLFALSDTDDPNFDGYLFSNLRAQ